MGMEYGDFRKDCCLQSENLESQPSQKPELKITKCKICGCRHFELTVDPGIVGIKT